MLREEIPMHDRVLDLLERHGQQDWLSGEVLSAELGISRSSLSKYVSALRTEGNVIETMPRRGYKLISRADPWVGDDVQKNLLTRSLGQGRWIWLKDAESTNRVAAHEALDGAEEGLVVAARWQTEPQEGKHSWMKQAGSLNFSVVIRVNWPADRLSELSLLVQEACVAAVLAAGGPELECRAPNYLYLNGSKVAAVLVQSQFHNSVMRWAVIGVGLNVNTPADTLDGEFATSLYAETGRAFSITAILKNILEELEQRIG